MNKIITAVLIFLACTAAVFLYFSGKEYTIEITNNQLQEKLEKKLPLTKKA